MSSNNIWKDRGKEGLPPPPADSRGKVPRWGEGLREEEVWCSIAQNTHPLTSPAEELSRAVVMRGDPGVLPSHEAELCLDSKAHNCSKSPPLHTRTHTQGKFWKDGLHGCLFCRTVLRTHPKQQFLLALLCLAQCRHKERMPEKMISMNK